MRRNGVALAAALLTACLVLEEAKDPPTELVPLPVPFPTVEPREISVTVRDAYGSPLAAVPVFASRSDAVIDAGMTDAGGEAQVFATSDSMVSALVAGTFGSVTISSVVGEENDLWLQSEYWSTWYVTPVYTVAIRVEPLAPNAHRVSIPECFSTEVLTGGAAFVEIDVPVARFCLQTNGTAAFNAIVQDNSYGVLATGSLVDVAPGLPRQTLTVSSAIAPSPVTLEVSGLPPTAAQVVAEASHARNRALLGFRAYAFGSNATGTVPLAPYGAGIATHTVVNSSYLGASMFRIAPIGTTTFNMDGSTYPAPVLDGSAIIDRESGLPRVSFTVGDGGAPADATEIVLAGIDSASRRHYWELTLPPTSTGSYVVPFPALPSELVGFREVVSELGLAVSLVESDVAESPREVSEVLHYFSLPMDTARVSRSFYWNATVLITPPNNP